MALEPNVQAGSLWQKRFDTPLVDGIRDLGTETSRDCEQEHERPHDQTILSTALGFQTYYLRHPGTGTVRRNGGFAPANGVCHTLNLMPGRIPPRLIGAYLALLLVPLKSHTQSLALADGLSAKPFEGSLAPFPSAEKLSYDIEWRLIYAGSAHLDLEPKPGDPHRWDSQLHVESGGMVSKLYRLEDNYNISMQDGFCTSATYFNALEGNRHRETRVVYDHSRGKASYVERDLEKNAVVKTSEVEISPCSIDVVAGLYKLRMDHLEPGQSLSVPMSDGKKSVNVRVEGQAREQLKIKAGTFNTIRYEIFLFNGVLYPRKADLFIWLTDDAHRLPVQIRARMSFPIGNITFELVKDEHP
jgi:hypothetical protein